MNRQQRRAAHRQQRKFEVGSIVRATTLTAVGEDGRRHLYWFEEPEGFSPENGLPPGVTLHGPFETDAEVKEHQRKTLLGPQCKLTEGGEWDPNWDKPQ